MESGDIYNLGVKLKTMTFNETLPRRKKSLDSRRGYEQAMPSPASGRIWSSA
jgi:hypothetical protein